MTNPVHILVVEDSSADYELIVHELMKGGLRCEPARVETEEDLARALTEQPPDVLLCDHASAHWDSVAVLTQVRARDPTLPFIIVTGAMREETLAWAREHGADECVFKNRLPDLAPVVRGALRLGEERRHRQKAERERDRLRRQLRTFGASLSPNAALPICADCKKIRDRAGNWARVEDYFHKLLGIHFTHGLCPTCVQKYAAEIPDRIDPDGRS